MGGISINATVIEGNLTADATRRDLATSSVVNFRIASNGGSRAATFVPCAIFGKYGDAMLPYLTKGAHVVVTGSLRGGGVERQLSLVVSRIVLAGKPVDISLEELGDYLIECME